MLAISLPQLCWGRWREAPDGVWPAASTQVGLHDHRCERASIQTCFPHRIRPFGPPSPLRGEGGRLPRSATPRHGLLGGDSHAKGMRTQGDPSAAKARRETGVFRRPMREKSLPPGNRPGGGPKGRMRAPRRATGASLTSNSFRAPLGQANNDPIRAPRSSSPLWLTIPPTRRSCIHELC
jgi:hypothetical protein